MSAMNLISEWTDIGGKIKIDVVTALSTITGMQCRDINQRFDDRSSSGRIARGFAEYCMRSASRCCPARETVVV
jgi:hypothetical protein